MEIIMQNNMNSNNSNKRIINHVTSKANKRSQPTQATIFTACTHVGHSMLPHSSPATYRSNCSA